MLKNAYLFAKIGTDTAENEQHFAHMSLEARSGSLLAFDGRRTDPLLARRSAYTLLANTLSMYTLCLRAFGVHRPLFHGRGGAWGL